MEAETVAERMNSSSHGHFRLRILPPYPGHYPGSMFSRQRIHDMTPNVFLASPEGGYPTTRGLPIPDLEHIVSAGQGKCSGML